jgi:hypothetical protein
LRVSFDISDVEALALLRTLPIIHLHGSLGDLSEYPYQSTASPTELLSISRGIQIIHEIEDLTDNFCNDRFRSANIAMTQAARVYFMGFGFNPNNLRRFRLPKDFGHDKGVLATCNGINRSDMPGVKALLAGVGIGPIATQSDNCERLIQNKAALD